ncbi:hypothetical protein PMAC_002771 [Pneumocystis sp. 'macacae']|nr:hypothetical protein PMAC_002771 [Pneumocystis sp. 'macacae']
METNKQDISNEGSSISSNNSEIYKENPLIGEAVEFDLRKNRWTYEDKDRNEYEYDDRRGIWVLSTDEELIRRQQEAYAVEGVDESIPVNKQRKRKKKASVYVSNLPLDVTEDEIRERFSKCGVISENIDTGKPRIKIYVNERGEPKGDAVVIFFREESVKLAIQLLDDTCLRLDDKNGQKMRVQQVKDNFTASFKISEWDDNNSTTSGRWSKVVILKHMFTLKELEDNITLIMDLKEDILEECSKIGNVTNVVLFDLEPEGVVSVRFSDEESALVCVKIMNGRYFGGKIVEAKIYDGKVRYRKSSNRTVDENDIDEQTRLEKFGHWLESGE